MCISQFQRVWWNVYPGRTHQTEMRHRQHNHQLNKSQVNVRGWHHLQRLIMFLTNGPCLLSCNLRINWAQKEDTSLICLIALKTKPMWDLFQKSSTMIWGVWQPGKKLGLHPGTQTKWQWILSLVWRTRWLLWSEVHSWILGKSWFWPHWEVHHHRHSLSSALA